MTVATEETKKILQSQAPKGQVKWQAGTYGVQIGGISISAGMVLRIAFGVYFLLWGIEKIRRAGLWGSEQMLGSFYGSMGSVSELVILVGIVQLLVALAFLANFKTRIASIAAFGMIASSLFVTFVPMVTYIFSGGTPIPNFLFTDHFPMLGGVWAIYATAK